MCVIKKYKVISFPSRVGADTTAEFEPIQEFMTQERVAIAGQLVPVCRIDPADCRVTFNLITTVYSKSLLFIVKSE